MNWLEQDMSRTEQTWKIVMMHRPPYEGQISSGNGLVHRYVPRIMDNTKVDLVISGHDHLYSRSLPVQKGQIADEGTTYLIAGSASSKFYDAYGGGIAPLADVLFDDNVHTYTTLAVRGNKMHIETRAINGKLVDRHTITAR